MLVVRLLLSTDKKLFTVLHGAAMIINVGTRYIASLRWILWYKYCQVISGVLQNSALAAARGAQHMTEIEHDPAADGETLPERALLVYKLLGEVYGIKPWKPRREPLHELISTILSHRTTQANEARAFEQLWEKY